MARSQSVDDVLNIPNEQFLAVALHGHQYRLPSQKPKLGDAYLNSNELLTAQDLISVDEARFKLRRAADKGLIRYSKKNGWQWTVKGLNPVVPNNDPLIVVLTALGPMVIDGNHHLLMSRFIKADMIPVKIIADLSHLNPADLKNEMIRRHWLYFQNIDAWNRKDFLPTIKNWTDFPMRHFMSALSLKVQARWTGKKVKVEDITHYRDDPIWMKINQGIPFIEFILGHMLTDAGIRFSYEMSKDEFQDNVKKARKLLKQLKEPYRDYVVVIESKDQAKKLIRDKGDIAEVLETHFSNTTGCKILNLNMSSHFADAVARDDM
jgi:hypothetical protein